jgi:hypothetical protein
MSFYWYERDADLLNEEKAVMAGYFSQFQMGKLPNGKLYWIGELMPGLYSVNKPWKVQAIYQHNHPSSTGPDGSPFAGSVRVYSIIPNLDEMVRETGLLIPHTLRDEAGSIYMCTSGKEHINVGEINTSAASHLAWAVKWISAYELWVAGELSTEEFSGHSI